MNNNKTEYWFTLTLFFLCRHFCAPVYSLFLLFVISVLFQNAVMTKTETVRLEHSKQSSPSCLPFLRRKKKKNKRKTEYILVPALAAVALLHCMTHWLTERTICGMYLNAFLYGFVCLYVCLFVQFSLSVCAKAQTQTRVLVPLKSCD